MSADIRGSAARSSSATDASSDTNDLGTLARSGISTVIIASEWHFKPAGVMEVEKRFAEKRDRMRANTRTAIFNGSIRIIISSFFQKDTSYPFRREMNQITKAIVVQEGGDRDSDDEHEEADGSSDDTFYPDTIKTYSYRDIWIYHGEELIDEFLKLAIVLELQTITDSKIVKSPSQSKVYIGSDKRGSVDVVVNKLNNIAKYSSTYASQYHIFYTEEVEPCKFIIKAFSEIKKKYLETTLFEQEHPPGFLLTKIYS
ncbi:uncharacterized protein EAF02_007417 [Botrytis sinoallii]|uniref:uncharacterized protein n=1 Tax=Botrytis sinoallii TaxID=1463999 RepID=UPI001902102F|nr:uncharacterized protein EAF02_007417 [Botrytis sinoallii]KAF7880571.1 hypothetical protein EAF02_007417 [Botrytis sinoallii]